MSAHVRRPSLVANFALMSLVFIAAIGVVLAGSVARVIRDRNLESVQRTAQLASRLAIQSQLTTANVSDGLPPEALRRLDRELQNGVLGRSVTRLNIWSRQRYHSNVFGLRCSWHQDRNLSSTPTTWVVATGTDAFGFSGGSARSA